MTLTSGASAAVAGGVRVEFASGVAHDGRPAAGAAVAPSHGRWSH
jgi:hypothetical protein